MKGFFPVRFVKLREFKGFLRLTSHTGYGTSSEISLDRIIYLLSVGRAGEKGEFVGVWFEDFFFPENNLF